LGLTLSEAGAFCLGAALLLLFRTLLPKASRRVSATSDRLSETLREEFVQLPAARIASVLLLSGLVCGGLALMALKSSAAAVVSGVAPVLLAGTAIRRYRSRRRKRILSQIPLLLDLAVGHLKAGHSFPESLAESAPLLPSGIREEMAWVLQKHRLGTPLVEAFELFEERMRSEDLALLVRPLRAALAGGGNVIDLLEQTRDILRRKNRSREKLRSMTAQARLQAVVLTLLTPSFAAVLSRIDPGFFPSLVGTAPGRAILLSAFILQALGWLTIRKILSVRL
jgi:tight adherence protein B